MGYTTTFKGAFLLDRQLTKPHAEYLMKFAETRRVTRDAAKAALLPDAKRERVGLPVGPEGAYFVGGAGFMGQDSDPSVIDGNAPPGSKLNGNYRERVEYEPERAQPGLWCQWVPRKDRRAIVWNGGEKFYAYRTWLQYLVIHFLKPWGYQVDGCTAWRGEDSRDRGVLTCLRGEVRELHGARLCAHGDCRESWALRAACAVSREREGAPAPLMLVGKEGVA